MREVPNQSADERKMKEIYGANAVKNKNDKVALMNAVIDYNVNMIARKIILWYES